MEAVIPQITSILVNIYFLYLIPQDIDISITDSVINITIIPINQKMEMTHYTLDQVKNILNNKIVDKYRLYIMGYSGYNKISLKKVVITGYLKIIDPNYFLISAAPENYFQTLPLDMIKLIIPRLNRLELISLLNSLYDNDNIDYIFESIIYSLVPEKGMYQMLKELCNRISSISWKHMYLIAFDLIHIDEDKTTEDVINRWWFYNEYPKLYQELIKYEDLVIPGHKDQQFYLGLDILGFNWKKYFEAMDGTSKILICFEEIVTKSLIKDDPLSGKSIDIVKLMDIFQEETCNLSKPINRSYYTETLDNLFSITNKLYKDLEIQIIQYFYNVTGDTAGLTYIYDLDLFKWFRGIRGSFEIINTKGPIDYNDFYFDDLVEMWSAQYIDGSPEDRKNMDQTLEFIAADWPEFNKDDFNSMLKNK